MPNKLTKSVVDHAHPADRDYFLWDSDLKGFGIKISKGGRKTYVCKYRVGAGRSAPTRRYTIGAHGSPWTVDQARAEARRILGRAANGEDPAQEKQDEKKQITVTQLCDLYLEHGTGTKKPSTVATDRGRIKRHIKPLLGKKKVRDVTRADIKRFLQDVSNGKTSADVKTGLRGRAIVRGGKGAATRTVGLLGGIFSYAIDCGLIETNPVHGVKRFPDRKGERYLNQNELVRLGQALQLGLVTGINPQAIAILKLLMFTGMRKREIETLRWSEVDSDRGYLRLEDSKTGQKSVPLSAPARQVISEIPALEGSTFVFPAFRGNGFYEGTPKVWKKIRKMAGIEDVRLHDLRHSFASVAVSGGASLPLIGSLLGHKDVATTHRYAHLYDDPVRAASEAVGAQLDAFMAVAAVRK
ncbi:tyrosine-type recombinase/integrase [Hoeflea sp. WL0058]|uniref:Tyrosine-type recombinase/integrase n=1 Tax=Flavimaribacter sediminis TaxID=2865987 RepID=A0AAE3D056_9HYPH|nr:site-specific integrase [Flavimaribacter sediminis]MBW8637329.1 tyrosine-type recombinase/integrase [Flavimaribacter sediminis]